MDDIYDDLENYNDVNAIDELRNENKELKFKVEEYAASMEKLQQDFDKLSSEFKKLEINYSSLLKTARAEIERKTQIIDNLNKEKDMIVLNSIQNSNKSLAMLRRNIVRDRSGNRKPRKDVLEPEIAKATKKEDGKRFDAERDRNEENRFPSIETVSSGNTDDVKKIPSSDSKIKLEKSTDSKENMLKGKKAQGLKHRRKSMPAASKQYGKFSSDEEYEGHCSTEEAPREWSSREDKSRKHFDRHKQSHKISETSGIDEKYSSYHESSRETYYKGKPRYSDYRSARDRYVSSRHKRLYSPERSRRQRDYPEDKRQEYGRHRVLESPPPVSFDPHRRYRDRRPNYEKDNSVEERFKHRQERLLAKPTTPSENYEAPPSKRPRTDSGGFPGKEDGRWDSDPPPVQEKPMPVLQVQSQHTSCQSPDYVNPEAVVTTAPPAKEIRHTADTKLEDPRLTSKRYVKHIEGDKVIQTSVSGKNTFMKHVDVSAWNIPRMKTPEALRKPPEDVDKVVQDVYANIDDPMLNNSFESGELRSETNDGFTIDYVTENFLQDYENEENNLKSLGRGQVTSLQDYGREISNKERSRSEEKQHTIEKPKNDRVEVDNEAQSLFTKYKIPKKRPEQDMPSPLGILLEQLHSACGIDKQMRPKENKLDVDKMFSTDDEKPPDNKALDKPKPVEKLSKNSRQLRCGRKLSAREIVEGDLELSDDTIDNTDVQKHCKPTAKTNKTKPDGENKEVQLTMETQTSKGSKNNQHYEKIITSNEENKRTSKLVIENKDALRMTIKTVEKETSSDCKIVPKSSKGEKLPKEDKLSKTEEKLKTTRGRPRKRKSETENGNKRSEDTNVATSIPKETAKVQLPDVKKEKVRKKSPKQKDAGEKEKKTRGKKEGNVKAKFSDLFGDSSSLITPDDLGLVVAPAVQTDTIKTYVPIFEDAQDAIDVNVKVVCEKMDSPSPPTETTSVADTPKITETKAASQTEPKNDEVCITVQEGTKNIEVMNTERTIEPDVVKTVIISTGVQPQMDNIEPTNNNVVTEDRTHKIDLATKVSLSIPLSAFATSTPHKRPLLAETEVESSCASSEKDASKDVSSAEQSSVSNIVDTQNDDAPDFRIVVRRRRRLKK